MNDLPAKNPESYCQRAVYRAVAMENRVAARPANLPDTLDCINPTLYRNVNTILSILLTMPVSTATPQRSFSTMRRVKTYLRATIKTERLLAFALMYMYKDITIDGEAVARELRQEEQDARIEISVQHNSLFC